MKVYLVGGAVRDALLGRPPGDRDYVVVGASPAQMLARGFRPVGRDFPVFLHPESGEEYALARSERKQGHGYRGFVVHATPDVTLEDDLRRRDFTINAIARAEDGRLIDPFDGLADLEARILRHVSPAFAEDPVRILRAARFMARFAHLGFRLAEETLSLMRQMVASGEVAHLVPERVYQELRRGLGEASPAVFIKTLRSCGALASVLPEVDALYGVPQAAEHHPEIDTGAHIELCLAASARLAPGDGDLAFAVLVHDLGKALTERSQWPHHIGHEHRGIALVRALCARLKVPAEVRDFAVLACAEHLNVHRLAQMRAASVHDLLLRCDAFRRRERIARLALVCQADWQGRAGHSDAAYAPAELIQRAFAAAAAVNARDLPGAQTGPALGARLRQARIAAIRAALARPDTDTSGSDRA